MSAGARYLILLSCAASLGCGRGTLRGAVDPRPQPAAMPLEQVLSERCGACHDGEDPTRPSFDARTQLDRRELMRVGLALSAARMPPESSSPLPPSLRDEILREVCRRSAVEPGREQACLALLVGDGGHRSVVRPARLLDIQHETAAALGWVRPSDEQHATELRAALDAVALPLARRQRWTATLVADLAVSAAWRCSSATGEALTRCVRALTDPQLGDLPALTPAAGSAPASSSVESSSP